MKSHENEWGGGYNTVQTHGNKGSILLSTNRPFRQDLAFVQKRSEECLPVKIRQIRNFPARVENSISLIFLW